jgi:hypothetical protein
MTRSPLLRACVTLRVPRGLYLLRGEVPLSDGAIRLALRQQHVATERLVLALAHTLTLLKLGEDASDVWSAAAHAAAHGDLPASMVGMLAALAMLPDEGAINPDEWALVVEAAP